MKPYNFTDVEIAVSAILLIFSGVIGSIIFSLLLKKTSNYRMVLSCLLGGTICAITCFPINILFGNWKIVTIIAFTVLGFFMTPIIPVSYDLGCELAFPMGEAQVTGFLNGAALLWAFLIGLIMSLIIGYGDSHKSLFWILGLFVLIMSGALLLKTVKLNLKRKDFETNKLETTMTPVEVEMTAQQDKAEENQSKIVDFVEVD